MKTISIIIIILLLTIITGCDLSDPEEVSETQIREGLEDIQRAFNYHHLDEIMEYYHWNYLHNGDDKDDAELDWDIRLNDYQEIEFTNIEIELDIDRATVRFEKHYLINGSVVHITDEPADSGDLSYWGLEDNVWQVRGNRVPLRR